MFNANAVSHKAVSHNDRDWHRMAASSSPFQFPILPVYELAGIFERLPALHYVSL